MDIGFADDGLLSIVRVQNLPHVLGRSAADSQRKNYTGQVTNDDKLILRETMFHNQG